MTAIAARFPTSVERPHEPAGSQPLAEARSRSLSERLRAAFAEGAEEDSRRRLGRGLTREELERVLRRYPGDLSR